MPKIYFVGMPGCGKSYLGKRIAREMGIPFFDLDEVITMVTGMSIDEIFKTKGEEYFREIEAQSLRKTTIDNNDFLMSTGGGAPCFHENMDFINSNGISVFINLSLETIAKDLLKKGLEKRPLLKNFNEHTLLGELQDKYDKRKKFYQQAHIVVDLKERSLETVRQALAGRVF